MSKIKHTGFQEKLLSAAEQDIDTAEIEGIHVDFRSNQYKAIRRPTHEEWAVLRNHGFKSALPMRGAPHA
jgi:hypothetical protein